MQILLQLLENIEAVWQEDDKKSELLDRLKDYFKWFKFNDREHALLKNMAHLNTNISTKMTLRQLLDIAVPLERFLNVSVKDEGLIKINSKDQKNKIQKTWPMRFVLDHLRSAFNVGSLFRTAECLGVEHIHLVGYTPTPDDVSVKKTAMGTENLVAWSAHNHVDDLITELKNAGYLLVGFETMDDAIPLQDFVVDQPVALFVGNERYGLEPALVQKMDVRVVIPMMGVKNSLNVANSLSIAAFEVLRQFTQRNITKT